jgi:hypothetical protein
MAKELAERIILVWPLKPPNKNGQTGQDIPVGICQYFGSSVEEFIIVVPTTRNLSE